MDITDRLVTKIMIGIYFAIIIGIVIISTILHHGEEGFWPGILIEAIMESIIIGISFLLARKQFHKVLKDSLLQAQEREQSNMEK